MADVFYLGPEGSFSHILARKRFGRSATLHSCSSIETIFDQVRQYPAAHGLVPIENSSGGTLYDTVDLLIRHLGQIHVQEELALDVRIALLGRSGEAIKTVYSHFVQIKHHADWLKSLHPDARLKPVASTSIAAQKAAAQKNSAALASHGAAEIYGLEVLQAAMGGPSVNVTHFFVIGAREAAPVSGPCKTALVATLPNTCGSLHQFLGPFARQKVSLTRIISRPVPGQPQTYVFFLEIEGSPHDGSVATALKRARPLTESLASLGSFPIGRRFKS